MNCETEQNSMPLPPFDCTWICRRTVRKSKSWEQLLRSGTSVAANFREASRARTTAEFISDLETCIREADESDLWLQFLRDDCAINTDSLVKLLEETNEL